MTQKRGTSVANLMSIARSLTLLAIAGLRFAEAQIIFPVVLFHNDSWSTDVSSSVTCDAGSQYFDQAVLGCNSCVDGLGSSTISNPLLVCRW
jgi:hypothetical protein